jgi:hypothetical protein
MTLSVMSTCLKLERWRKQENKRGEGRREKIISRGDEVRLKMSPEKGNDNFYWATGRIFFWIFSMKKDKGDGSLGKNPMETKHIVPIFLRGKISDSFVEIAESFVERF